MNNQIKIELDNWLKPQSALVTFARSLRMENPKAGTSDSSKGNSSDADADDKDSDSILTGVDLDSLPADVRDKLVAKDAEFKQLATAKSDFEAKLTNANQQIAGHQSRADRALAKLQQHNIPLEGSVNTQSKDGEDDLVTELTKAFMQEGLNEQVARIQAKLAAKSAPLIEKRLSLKFGQSLSPMVQVIGDMQADAALAEAMKNDTEGYLNDKEVYKNVVSSIKLITSQAGKVDSATIESLVDIELGRRARSGKPLMPQQQQQQTSRKFQTRLQGGEGNVVDRGFVNNDSSTPSPANEDTRLAVNATVANMLRGTGVKLKS